MDNIKKAFTGLLFLGLSGAVFSNSSSLFSIREDCRVATPYLVTLCLNGKGPLSCQNYIVNATHLKIKTNISDHSYASVGIKSDTPLYRPTNCTSFSNGYCLFSANNSAETTIIMEPLFQLNQLMVC